MIVRGKLPPERRLVEAELARRFGVSRTPIRNALVRLRSEGYVTGPAEAGRLQLTVAPLRRADVDELWSILGALEGLAAETLESRSADARRALAECLRTINDDLDRASGPPREDPDQLMELQSGFHRELVAHLGGAWLNRLYALLRPHAERYEWIYGSLGESDLAQSTAEHRQIITLVDRGRAADLAAALHEHWDRARQRTGDLIGRYWG